MAELLGVFRSWHHLRQTITDQQRNTKNIAYLGVSDVSIVIETLDGERWRITNPNFLVGLKIVKE